MNEVKWAIVTNGRDTLSHCRQWYHVSRVVNVDGKMWELYWHPSLDLRGGNQEKIRKAAKVQGLELFNGVFRDALPHCGNQLELSK